MTNLFALYRFPLVAALLLGLAACGGDGGGDDDNFLRITEDNAIQVARSAVGSLDGVTILTEASTALKPAAIRPALAEIVQWTLRRAIRGQFVAARSVSEDCGPELTHGRITGVASDNPSSIDSELRFEQCNLAGSGIVLDGQITLIGSANTTSGAYSFSFDGRIVITFGSEPPVTLAFDAQQSGNEISGDYSLDFSISVSGPPNTGFRMQSTDTLVGNANLDEIYDGTIVLNGAGDTRLRLDIIATDFVDIDIDKGSGTYQDYEEVGLDTL